MSAEEKEKVQVYTDPEVARAMRVESANRGITQGELLAEMWALYLKKDQVSEATEAVESGYEDEHESEHLMRILEHKNNQDALRRKDFKIKRAKEILANPGAFSADIIEIYAEKMSDIGEEALAQELRELVKSKASEIE